jgi:hypothetical protein
VYTGVQSEDARFPNIALEIDGKDVVVRYPRGDRTVTVTLRETSP